MVLACPWVAMVGLGAGPSPEVTMVDFKDRGRTMRVLDLTPFPTTSHPFTLSSLHPVSTRGPLLLYYLLLLLVTTRLSYTAWAGLGR